MRARTQQHGDRFAISPAHPHLGGKIDISFFNPQLAEQEVKIGILNGPDLKHELEIRLDASGKGSAEWQIPFDLRWHWISLIHETSLVHTARVHSKGPMQLDLSSKGRSV